ncbi:hypothetical protein FRX31_019539 [Thalictrum thalictroides]|uniref:Uncharacterized protein n=1 Tax=Thalictrum thalictroides TaxID=46969 RepID=A0A7J6W1A2_THATH|nr:hypothetical protein FRX31_019539 [Thalictrum thalictroides]
MGSIMAREFGHIGELGVGITAKAGAGRTGQHGEAESAQRCAAGQGSDGLNMGQFANDISAGHLPGCQEKFSSIATGETAKAVAGRPMLNTKTVAAGYNDGAVATKSGKISNNVAAGHGNQGLTMGHLAKSSTAGQRGAMWM